jgi:hypothetical protein
MSMLFWRDHKATGIAPVEREEVACFAEERQRRARLVEAEAKIKGAS